jgi:hypothetical protein
MLSDFMRKLDRLVKVGLGAPWSLVSFLTFWTLMGSDRAMVDRFG